MTFEIPEQRFNATEHARNKMIRANQTLQGFLRGYIEPYEEFWGVSGSEKREGDIYGSEVSSFYSNGSRYTTEEMQQIINVIGPSNLINLLTQAAAFVQFMEAAYPGVLPERYKTAAFDYEIGPSGVILTGINSFWEK